jgi:hypothetical protein
LEGWKDAVIVGVVGNEAGFFVKIYGNINSKTKTGYNCVLRAARNKIDSVYQLKAPRPLHS